MGLSQWFENLINFISLNLSLNSRSKNDDTSERGGASPNQTSWFR